MSPNTRLPGSARQRRKLDAEDGHSCPSTALSVSTKDGQECPSSDAFHQRPRPLSRRLGTALCLAVPRQITGEPPVLRLRGCNGRDRLALSGSTVPENASGMTSLRSRPAVLESVRGRSWNCGQRRTLNFREFSMCGMKMALFDPALDVSLRCVFEAGRRILFELCGPQTATYEKKQRRHESNF